jgi:hypothetical protein
MLISNLLKKFHKNSHIDKLTNMSKSEKVHISVMLLLLTFFAWNFCQPFLRDSKSASNSAFFNNHIDFNKIFWIKFCSECRRNGSKKRKKNFINVS